MALFLNTKLIMSTGDQRLELFDGNRQIYLLAFLDTSEFCALLTLDEKLQLPKACSEHNIFCFSDISSATFECNDCGLQYHVECVGQSDICGCRDIPLIKNR